MVLDLVVHGNRADIAALHLDGPAARPDKAGDAFEQGGLAAAIGAENGDDLTARGREVDALKDIRAIAIAGAYFVDADHADTFCLATDLPR